MALLEISRIEERISAIKAFGSLYSEQAYRKGWQKESIGFIEEQKKRMLINQSTPGVEWSDYDEAVVYSD